MSVSFFLSPASSITRVDASSSHSNYAFGMRNNRCRSAYLLSQHDVEDIVIGSSIHLSRYRAEKKYIDEVSARRLFRRLWRPESTTCAGASLSFCFGAHSWQACLYLTILARTRCKKELCRLSRHFIFAPGSRRELFSRRLCGLTTSLAFLHSALWEMGADFQTQSISTALVIPAPA